MRGRLTFMAILVLVGGCGRSADRDAPPHADDPVPQPQLVSTISVPIDADPRALRAAVERAIPRVLWTIDQRIERCIAPQRVRVLGRDIKLTPAIACSVVGEAVRGPIRLRGVGRDIIADLPVQARITARDAGGKLKGETATGSAMVHARIRLDVDRNWTPRGTVQLSYDWTTPPGIDLLGNRIAFTDKADEKLRPIVAELERTLPAELAKLNLRRQVETLWRRGFTTVSLNADRPPVWMRITPRRLRYDNYALSGEALRLNLAIDAVTETFVGKRPADPTPSTLPPLVRDPAPPGLRFFFPVIADYAQLEPVIMRALTKRSLRPFDLPGATAMMAKFDRVQAYGTTGRRIAVGLNLSVWPVDEPNERTSGLIWFSAQPVNTPGSAQVSFTNLTISGDTDGVGGDVLLALGNSPGLADAIAAALGQNFSGDLGKLLVKVRAAIANKPIDDFVIQAKIDQVETGRIVPFGRGLYMPVRVTGDARIRYRPRP